MQPQHRILNQPEIKPTAIQLWIGGELDPGQINQPGQIAKRFGAPEPAGELIAADLGPHGLGPLADLALRSDVFPGHLLIFNEEAQEFGPER